MAKALAKTQGYQQVTKDPRTGRPLSIPGGDMVMVLMRRDLLKAGWKSTARHVAEVFDRSPAAASWVSKAASWDSPTWSMDFAAKDGNVYRVNVAQDEVSNHQVVYDICFGRAYARGPTVEPHVQYHAQTMSNVPFDVLGKVINGVAEFLKCKKFEIGRAHV